MSVFNAAPQLVRRAAWTALGWLRSPPPGKEWIQFLFYHSVLETQRASFQRQLQSMRRYGEFISLGDAVDALHANCGIGGRYFCLTFDDGFRSWLTNVIPILKEEMVPASFFIPTGFIGSTGPSDRREAFGLDREPWPGENGPFEFLDWEECRHIVAAGFTVGSHTHSHSRLTHTQSSEAEVELRRSKQEIESRLGISCDHFCCPWGKVHRDYDPAVHPELARRIGYRSFLTTDPGTTFPGSSPLRIPRAGCEPDLAPAQLRYAMFSRAGAVNEHQPVNSPREQAAKVGADMTVREPEPVKLNRFPYPYQAAVSVASDIDGASITRLQAVHALFCGRGLIRADTPEWRTLGLDCRSSLYDESQGGIRGLGFDYAHSFFLFGDAGTFGMYRHFPDQNVLKEDEQDGVSGCSLIRQWIRGGAMDSFHGFLHYRRETVKPVLEGLYHWCERERLQKPSVFINHSRAVCPTGLCPANVQPHWSGSLMRLGLRATIGPWLGRRRFPLSHAFASYQGDTPGSPYYVNDLLAANGLRYVWLNVDDLHRNQIALPEVFENGRPTILRRVRMDDGTRYYRFERCYGKLPGRVGGEASLRESPEAYDTSVLITETNLRDLCLAEGTCILYTHWTHSRSLPLQESTLKRFALLQSWRDAGKIWAPPISRLLEWTRRRTFLRVVSRREGKRLLVELDGIDDPIFGREPASLSNLDGLSLVLPSADQEITIVVGGEALEANHVHRSGKLCWLDAHGDLTAPKRETSSERQTCV